MRVVGTFVVFCLLAVGRAQLIAGSDQWWISPTSAPVSTSWVSPNPSDVTFSLTENLTHSLNVTLDTLTVVGQASYNYQIIGTQVSSINLANHGWRCYAQANPFLGGAFATITANGFLTSASADFNVNNFQMLGMWSDLATRPPATITTSSGGWQTAGSQFNYNLSATGATYNYTNMLGRWVSVWNSGLNVDLRPAGGAQYFASGTTITFTVDYPVSVTGVVVPEPSAFVALSLGVVLALRRKRP